MHMLTHNPLKPIYYIHVLPASHMVHNGGSRAPRVGDNVHGVVIKLDLFARPQSIECIEYII